MSRLQTKWENSWSICVSNTSRPMGRSRMRWRGSSYEMNALNMIALARSLIWVKRMFLLPLSNCWLRKNKRDWISITNSSVEWSAHQSKDITALLKFQNQSEIGYLTLVSWSKWKCVPKVSRKNFLTKIIQRISSPSEKYQFKPILRNAMKSPCRRVLLTWRAWISKSTFTTSRANEIRVLRVIQLQNS